MTAARPFQWRKRYNSTDEETVRALVIDLYRLERSISFKEVNYWLRGYSYERWRGFLDWLSINHPDDYSLTVDSYKVRSDTPFCYFTVQKRILLLLSPGSLSANEIDELVSDIAALEYKMKLGEHND
mgnify:CR=1 FL=1